MAQGTFATQTTPSARRRGEILLQRALRVPETGKASKDSAERFFSGAILLSAARCLVSYIVLPVIAPLVGGTAGVGPLVGIPIGVVALVFDVIGIRRFWLANHRWRWAMTWVYGLVMLMVIAFLVVDISAL